MYRHLFGISLINLLILVYSFLRPTNDGGTTLLLTFISLASTYERPTNDGGTTLLRLICFAY
ncbi:MAG: hypothetical protein K6G92_09300 [Bacteroidaceae bacterium]|nr:hypothetical protein [Bacteroidaceae bacterium]